MPRVFSGIQPTGDMHLGNYLGAVRQWAEGQLPAGNADQQLFCVVDLHAMTMPYDPLDLTERTLHTMMLLLAAGLDPERCTLYVQSHVSAHTELTWILNCIATFGELNRMTQFKEKGGRQESVTAGLFDYPVLMAADILAFDTSFVPIGDDQRQHLELTRDVAQRFNKRFGDTLVVPEAQIPGVGARIMDLQQPTSKMSKSADSPQGTLTLLDPPEVLRKRIRSAVTDSGSEVVFDREAKPGVSNLLEIVAAIRREPIEKTEADLAGTSYGALKDTVADAVIECLLPLQERYAELEQDPGEVAKIMARGAERARALAAPVIERTRRAAGLLPLTD